MKPQFAVGDKAVYPVRGVAEVVGIEHREIGGSKVSMYVLNLLESDSRILVPMANAASVGLRELISKNEVKDVFEIVKSKEMPRDNQTWNRRSREYMEKIKTGSVFEIAEVMRDLCLLKTVKELSFGERKMLELARGLVVRELAAVKGVGEDKINAEIDAIFVKPN